MPSPDRLDPAHPLFEVMIARHESALDEGRATYTDPVTGFSVFTARFLWERGTCCETGCRHCPYVPR
jgi:hypothetical protein